jgi:hypothetical protein
MSQPTRQKDRRPHITGSGHGNIVVDIDPPDGPDLPWGAEAPRFFEAMLLGKRWDVVHQITSRICGICSIGHNGPCRPRGAQGIASRADHPVAQVGHHARTCKATICTWLLACRYWGGLGDPPGRHPQEGARHPHRPAPAVQRVQPGHLRPHTHPSACSGRVPQDPLPGAVKVSGTAARLPGALDAVVDLVASVAGNIPDFTGRPSTWPWSIRGISLIGARWAPASTRTAGLGVRGPGNEFLERQSTAKWAKNSPLLHGGGLARFNLTMTCSIPGPEGRGQAGALRACRNPYFSRGPARGVRALTEDSVASWTSSSRPG